MKKYSFLVASAITASLVLAACGTTEDTQPDNEKQPSTTVESADTAETTEPTTATETTETSNESTTETETADQPSSNDQTNSTTPEKPIAADIAYTASPEQNYEISLKQGYTLTAEEPGRDMVINDANDRISMRIEAYNKSDVNYKELAQTAQQTVEVTAPDGKYETLDVTASLAAHSDVLNAVAYKIVYTEDAEQAVTVVVEKQDKIIQLTIFDSIDSKFTNELLEMGFSVR